MRRAHNLDGNHSDVVKAFEVAGCQVLSLAGLGNGAPDLLVSCDGELHLVEVKDGSKPPSARKLTNAEEAFHAKWPVCVVMSAQGARALARRWLNGYPTEVGDV